MPDMAHRSVPAHTGSIAFALCTHFAPPTPLPTAAASTATVTPSYPFRCFHCDLSYRTSSQILILDTYNGLIDDQAARLRIAHERKGTDREGHFDDEMVGEGLRRIGNWEKKRGQEVEGVWAGFVKRWWGGVYSERKGGSMVERELRFRTVVGRDGGLVVLGLPQGTMGV